MRVISRRWVYEIYRLQIQFAIVQALLSPKFENVGLIAAHYGTRCEDGMERSYREIETIFDKMGFPKEGMIFRGAAHALPNIKTPVFSWTFN